MCFYGHDVDHLHVHSISVAEQLRMYCFDDLVVPTDVIQFSISGFHLYSPCLILDRIAVYGSSKCVLSRTDC